MRKRIEAEELPSGFTYCISRNRYRLLLRALGRVLELRVTLPFGILPKGLSLTYEVITDSDIR